MDRMSTVTRKLLFDLSERVADSKTIPVVVSSDDVVEVADGPEILVHTPDAIDFRRAPLPIIATHRGNQVNVGLVENLRPVNGRLRGDARFGERSEAVEYERDVLNGIIRSVSAGYARIKATVRKDGVLVTTRWMPTHVAMVAEPADVNAGFFRERANIPEFELQAEAAQTDAPAQLQAQGFQPAASAASMEANTMADSTNAAAGATAEVRVESGPIDVAQLTKDWIGTCRQFAEANDIKDERIVRHWIEKNDPKLIADDILRIKKARSEAAPAVLGMTQQEVGRFSIVRGINAVLNRDWSKAGFEAEVSRATAMRSGRVLNEHSFMVPLDVLRREMIVGTASSGGNLVGTDIRPQNLIELLRNRSVVFRLGATTLSGLQGSVTIPTQAAAGAVGWLGESGTATESNATVGQKTLAPKTIGGYQAYSRQLMLQSSIDVENFIGADLMAQIALGLDTAALAGTSTNSTQPLGIRFTSGLGTANPTSGTAVNYADMIRFQSTVATSNALFDGFAYVARPDVAAILMGKPRFTNSDTPIWEGGVLDGTVVGKRALASLQIGTGTVLGGDFSQVVIGEWGTMEIEVNPYANFQAGIVGVRAMYSADVLVRYGAAFAIGTGITG